MTLAQARAAIEASPHQNVFISLTDERIGEQAVAVKDLLRVKGTVTTGGGDLLPAVVDEVDAAVITAIRAAGCGVVGKTNLHEWAYGPTNDNPHYGAVRNPRDPSRITGGSSGGSAAAVAAGMCDWAIGTDTGGSIRIPAALCGVVGFKPTHGRIATEGLIPLSSTLDTIGPMAPDMTTAIAALAAMGIDAGHAVGSGRELGDYELAVPNGWVHDLDCAVGAAWARISKGLQTVVLPDRQRLADIQLTIMEFEATAYHRTWLETYPDRYGEDVLMLLKRGLEISDDAYRDALEQRLIERDRLEAALGGIDALLLPTTAIVAPPIAAPGIREPLARFTRPLSTTGHPAVSVPAGGAGLPVGMQLVAPLGHDEALSAIALAFEEQWGRTA